MDSVISDLLERLKSPINTKYDSLFEKMSAEQMEARIAQFEKYKSQAIRRIRGNYFETVRKILSGLKTENTIKKSQTCWKFLIYIRHRTDEKLYQLIRNLFWAEYKLTQFKNGLVNKIEYKNIDDDIELVLAKFP